jgi:hypothetical protein
VDDVDDVDELGEVGDGHRPDDRGAPAPGPADVSTPTRVVALTGVYHADGSLTGEVAYVVGKLLGRRHCALCDITHGALRERPEMAACRAALPVPFDLVHLDERSSELVRATDGRTPCVVAHLDGGRLEVVLDADRLEACEKQPAKLAEAMEAAVAGRGWSFAD